MLFIHYLHQLPFRWPDKTLFLSGRVHVFCLQMWVFVYSWGRKGGEQHVASCWGTEDSLEATSHPRVTPNSLNLPVSSPTFIQAYQYLLHERWKRLFSPARVCGFITIIIPKHRFGTNLPCCTTLISLHIKTEKKEKKMWFHRHTGLNYH